MRKRNITPRLLAKVALGLLAALAVAGKAGAQESAAPTGPPAGSPETPAPGVSGEQPPAQTVGERCGSAYERTQTEKIAGHYVAATAAALECSQLECNAAIVRECVHFYEVLQEETPTLVFSARKAEGGELGDVRVEMDGKPAAEQITGRPLAVDPGPHDFVFIHPQRGRMQVSETARVGDHARMIEVTFTDPLARAAPAVVLAPAPAPSTDRPRRIPVMTYVLGGVGVAALGSFVYFRVQAASHYNEYNATCSPRCNPDDVDSLRREFLFSYISIGVSAGALAGAGLVYFLTPRGHAVQATLTPRGDGAVAGLRTTF